MPGINDRNLFFAEAIKHTPAEDWGDALLIKIMVLVSSPYNRAEALEGKIKNTPEASQFLKDNVKLLCVNLEKLASSQLTGAICKEVVAMLDYACGSEEMVEWATAQFEAIVDAQEKFEIAREAVADTQEDATVKTKKVAGTGSAPKRTDSAREFYDIVIRQQRGNRDPITLVEYTEFLKLISVKRDKNAYIIDCIDRLYDGLALCASAQLAKDIDRCVGNTLEAMQSMHDGNMLDLNVDRAVYFLTAKSRATLDIINNAQENEEQTVPKQTNADSSRSVCYALFGCACVLAVCSATFGIATSYSNPKMNYVLAAVAVCSVVLFVAAGISYHRSKPAELTNTNVDVTGKATQQV